MRCSRCFGMLLLSVGLAAVGFLPAPAQASHASGGGTYFVEPGLLSEFQFTPSHVQCKVGHTVLGDGTVFQMWMFSTSVDSVSIDSDAGTVTLTGTMVSMVTLHFLDGTTAHLSETVPYTAYGEDNGTPGAGTDYFSLSVVYTPTAGLDQADLFGADATFKPFSGSIATGDVQVR